MNSHVLITGGAGFIGANLADRLLTSGHPVLVFDNLSRFEAAACGTPIISDHGPGVERFFTPDLEVLVARTPQEILHYLRELPHPERLALGWGSRARVLAAHTAAGGRA